LKRRAKPIISIQTEPGKWYRLDSPELTECCGCSLIHSTEYRFDKGRMFWRSKVDYRATRQKRKENGISIVKATPGARNATRKS
jgi:hypothetical protein